MTNDEIDEIVLGRLSEGRARLCQIARRLNTRGFHGLPGGAGRLAAHRSLRRLKYRGLAVIGSYPYWELTTWPLGISEAKELEGEVK